MNFIIVSAIVFVIGVFGILIRRNLIVMLMSVELMLSAANILFVGFTKMNGSLDGQAAVLFIYIIAACEAAVGLAIIVALYNMRKTVDISKWCELKR